jgi:hypothetical protein
VPKLAHIRPCQEFRKDLASAWAHHRAMQAQPTMEQARAENHPDGLDYRLWIITVGCTLLPVMVTVNTTIVMWRSGH